MCRILLALFGGIICLSGNVYAAGLAKSMARDTSLGGGTGSGVVTGQGGQRHDNIDTALARAVRQQRERRSRLPPFMSSPGDLTWPMLHSPDLPYRRVPRQANFTKLLIESKRTLQCQLPLCHYICAIIFVAALRKRDYIHFVEQKLKSSILFNNVYDRTSRPVRNDSESINVVIGMSLYHIVDTDEKMQIFTCVIAVRVKWRDQFLTWDPTKYENITRIWLPSNLIWIPELQIRNSVDYEYRTESNAIVESTGQVLWMYPQKVKLHCNFNDHIFPFDEQNCSLTMTSFGYDVRQVNLTASTGNPSYYEEKAQEWTIKGIEGTQSLDHASFKETGRKFPVSQIDFRIEMSRKSLFYIHSLLFPCVIIYFVALMQYFVPVDSGAKVNLPLTGLLSMVVLLMGVGEAVHPGSSNLAFVSKFYAWTMIECCLSLVCAVAVTNVTYRKDYMADRSSSLFAFALSSKFPLGQVAARFEPMTTMLLRPSRGQRRRRRKNAQAYGTKLNALLFIGFVVSTVLGYLLVSIM